MVARVCAVGQRQNVVRARVRTLRLGYHVRRPGEGQLAELVVTVIYNETLVPYYYNQYPKSPVNQIKLSFQVVLSIHILGFDLHSDCIVWDNLFLDRLQKRKASCLAVVVT